MALEPNIILAIIGAVGAVAYMAVKFLDKKKLDPTLQFDYTYLLSTLVAAVGVFMTFQTPVATLDPFQAVAAFMVGFAYSAGTATVNSKIPFTLTNGPKDPASVAVEQSINIPGAVKK
jgi:hypothetical protein